MCSWNVQAYTNPSNTPQLPLVACLPMPPSLTHARRGGVPNQFIFLVRRAEGLPTDGVALSGFPWVVWLIGGLSDRFGDLLCVFAQADVNGPLGVSRGSLYRSIRGSGLL